LEHNRKEDTEMADADVKRRTYVRPVGNIREEDGKVFLCLELPGVQKDALDLRIENDQLVIEARRAEPEHTGEYVVRERIMGDYYQSYTLDDTIDREKVDARMENGVLTVTLHMKESVKPRKIQITSG
jgi:HSP20 family protein